MSPKTKATLYVALCVSLWGLVPVVAKLGQNHLDHHQFLFWSSLVSFITLSLTALFGHNTQQLKSYQLKDWLYYAFLGLLGSYFYYLFLYLGYDKADGLEVLVIQYTWPILIVVFSIFILKEKLTIPKSIAITLGAIGVLVVLTKGSINQLSLNNASVIILVAIGAACFALFSVLSQSIKHPALGVISVFFLSATVASFFSMLYFSEIAWPNKSEIGPILVNGILVNGFSYLFWLRALSLSQASYLAPFVFITPVFSAFYLIIIFNEPIIMAYGVALALTILAGLINLKST